MVGAEDSAHPGPRPTWAEELLDHLRPTSRDVDRVVTWLAHTAGAEVSLTDDTGTLIAGTAVPLDEDLVADLTSGRIAAAAWAAEGRHLRLARVELPPPAASGVLAVARPGPFDRRTAEMVGHTAGVIDVLLRARETTAAGHRLERAAADLRLAILQLLMVEDTVSARRVAAGLWPGLLDTDTASVHVVESHPGDRDRLAAECLDAIGERALVVRCPAMDQHVIILTPGEAETGALRDLVRPRPHTFLGGSARQRLAQTATAYGQAVSALAVARFRPDKAAVYAERSHPERLMDPAALRAWTARVLRPLDSLPHHTRAELLATTRLGLEFTAVSTAKILGVSRNTVRARMERVEALLGADFSDLTARAAVHLAVNTEAGLDAVPDDGDVPAAPGFAELLAGPAVRAWAAGLLGRLEHDTRDLRRTLSGWIAAGGNAERAAHLLGVHAQTVREHVRSAEPVLERQLLTSGADLYETVLAHLALGAVPAPTLCGPGHETGTEPGNPDSPVHD
ncbi:helix-turn-helix domain-containing protein [Streptomyces sp. NPDC006997]|uniref:helix-turn-helix domain-containing protein n=1 Tax=Streptomyces sp. NPDC006997 TaxID=3155356 RepID=UPI0033CD2569